MVLVIQEPLHREWNGTIDETLEVYRRTKEANTRQGRTCDHRFRNKQELGEFGKSTSDNILIFNVLEEGVRLLPGSKRSTLPENI